MGESRLQFTEPLFGPFALGQIEHKRDALVAALLKQRATNQHRHATTIFAKILFLDRMKSSDGAKLCHGTFVLLAPLRGRQIGPAQAT
jgi:hypothetical protein